MTGLEYLFTGPDYLFTGPDYWVTGPDYWFTGADYLFTSGPDGTTCLPWADDEAVQLVPCLRQVAAGPNYTQSYLEKMSSQHVVAISCREVSES